MTVQISLSQIRAMGYTAEQFAAAVESYRMDRVAHASTVGQPAPHSSIPGSEICVTRVAPTADTEEKFVADYEIVNDLPPPPKPPTLDEKKMAHVQAAHLLAQQAFEANIPSLRRRYWSNLYSAALQVEQDKRDPGTVLFMKQHEDRLKQEQAINVHLGKLENQIADLTDETVDAWKPEAFPS